MDKLKGFLSQFDNGLGVVLHLGTLLAVIITATAMWTKMDYTIKTQQEALTDLRTEIKQNAARLAKVEKWVWIKDPNAQVGP